MSKVLLMISAVLLLASAGLGFVNKGKIAAKQDDLNSARTSFKNAQAEAATAKTNQKKAEKAASEAQAKSSDLQTQLTAATTQVTTLNGEAEKAKTDIAAKDTEIQTLKDTIAKINNPSAPAKADPTAPAGPSVADLQMQLAELKTVKDQLDTQVKEARGRADALQKEITSRKMGTSMNGLRGSILAVNRDWNFVVLSLGDRNGVNSNATMIIQRGGNMVGKVRITSVEPSQSIADIVPNSVPPGVTVQPGDTVVFPGT